MIRIETDSGTIMAEAVIAGIPVTLYRYVDPNGNLRDYGKRVLEA
jgi:UDP-N-acetylglucosamine 2-epimerase